MTPTGRWHAHRHTAGTGHLDQGRDKSFPVESDEDLGTVCRYVERNALRAGLVPRAEDWRRGSLWRRAPAFACAPAVRPALASWPLDRPAAWVDRVNAAFSPAEEEHCGAASTVASLSGRGPGRGRQWPGSVFSPLFGPAAGPGGRLGAGSKGIFRD
jgi:hypothetical protein